jgi:hypothetical protein
MMNHARILEAFEKRPFCDGALAERIKNGKVSDKTHATCAIGALLVDTGAVSADKLVNKGTNEMVELYWKELHETYGFETLRRGLPVHAHERQRKSRLARRRCRLSDRVAMRRRRLESG